VHVQDCWYSIHWLWLQQTAALHSVLLVLTKCLHMYMQYHVNCQQSILLHTVRYQTNKPILHLTHFTTTNINFTTFICTKEHWKIILTAYCLESADSQHSHCCCCPTNTLTAVHYTYSTTFVSPSAELKLFVLLLHWTLRYQQNILLLLTEVTECLSHCCFRACKGKGNKHCAAHSDTVVIAAVTHCNWFTSSSNS